MTDAALQSRAWTVCCDFHHEPMEIERHLREWEKQYGRTEDGTLIVPPAGWKILPYRTVIPHVHREYYTGSGWLFPRQCRSTMTPIFARPAARTRAYAVPD